jgi:hypothetical protein
VKLVVVIVVLGVIVVFVGSRLVDRGKDLSAVAKSTDSRLDSVTKVLQQATANVKKRPGDTEWQARVNTICASQSAALRPLGTPSSLDEIAAYLRRALPIVHRHHARLAALPPPDAQAGPASRAGKALLRQEGLAARARAAARRGDSAATLEQVDRLRSLARAANPNLVRMGLAECTLPSWGIPL